MFTFLKLLKPFFLPPTLIAIGMAAALVCVVRQRKRSATIVLAATLGVYVLLAIEPVAYALAWTLEHRYAASAITREIAADDPDAIIVLAGGATHARGYRQTAELSGASWRRLWQGITWHHAFGDDVPIIYSGGSGDPFDPISREAELAQRYAMTIGVAEQRFWIEDRSRNTYENGIEAQRLLERRLPDRAKYRILLVTSAWHLPRAVAVFERLGMTVIPMSADFMGGDLALDPLSFFPSVDAFSTSVTSIHEWVGMVGYRVMGRM